MMKLIFNIMIKRGDVNVSSFKILTIILVSLYSECNDGF